MLQTIIKVLSVVNPCTHSHIMQTNIYDINWQMLFLPVKATEYLTIIQGVVLCR